MKGSIDGHGISAYNQQSAISNQQSAISHNSALTFLKVTLKVIISGILSLIILSAGCYFYYNCPVSYTDKDGITDYRRKAGASYCWGVEGFGWGRMNNEGYVELRDYTPGMDIEILIMGSSHMEAFQVRQKDSASSLLSSEYGMKSYNLGSSSHFFPTCASRLKAAVKKYKPSKFAVIETGSVNFTEKTADDIIHGHVAKVTNAAHDEATFEKSILSKLRKMIYLPLLRRQLEGLAKFPKAESTKMPEKPAGREILSRMLAKLNDDVSLSGAKLIIAYHPPVSLNNDGSMKINDDPQIVKQFSELCADNGIYFINMAGRFLDEYRENHTLPYGFVNTSVGKGHMNKEGHRMFADEIYKLIQGTEAES